MSDAITSMYTFLMHNTALSPAAETRSASWEKLIDIKSAPALGGPPEKLDATTLSDRMERSKNGIQKLDAMEFTANYNKADFDKLLAMEGKEHEFAVWFGGTDDLGNVTPTGTDGKYKFKGELSVYVDGVDVNKIIDMKITIAPSTTIEPDKG